MGFPSRGEQRSVRGSRTVGDEGFRGRCLGRIEQFKLPGGSLLFASPEPELVDCLADRRLELRPGQTAG
jgi:ABC-type polysaccharide/polyol phosphate transport system ATPase subunit